MKEYKYKINGIKFSVAVGDVVDNKVHVEVNGTPYTVELDSVPALKQTISGPVKKPTAAPRTETGEKVISQPQRSTVANAIKSPLPGTIMNIPVNVGDAVKAGQTVCVLEAMKMENDIRAVSDGTVKQIISKVGDTVLEGADIMIIE